MLAAAIFCTLEKHLFDDTPPRAEVATSFCIIAAQLHKSVTGIEYQSGPHGYKRKRKTTDIASTSKKIQKTEPALPAAPSTSGETSHENPQTQEISGESEPDHPKPRAIPSKDTLSSSSLDSLPDVPFK